MLVDVMRGLVIRVFKGYRNARLAWYVASNSAPHMHKKRTSRKNKSHALFLVIHATKRAIVEVWPMKMGHRAAAFNVSKLDEYKIDKDEYNDAEFFIDDENDDQ